MLDQRGPDLRAVTVNQLDDVRWQTGSEQDLDEQRAAVRHLGGRLQDCAVAADERGKELPGRNREREIEGRDQATDADRAAVRHCPLIAQLARHGVAEEASSLSGGVVR